MKDYVEKIATMLKSAGIHNKHLQSVFDDNQKNKAGLNEILGLNPDNHFRKVLDIEMTDASFHAMYPWVKELFRRIPGWEGVLHPTTGKIKVGRDMVNITKFLSKQLAEGLVPVDYKQHLMHKLKIDPENPKAEAQIVPKFGELLNTKDDNAVVISTNPFDFFTSSAQDFRYAAFKSCFRPGGEYFNACNSLARDHFSTITYKASKSKIDYKHGRAWLFIFEQIIAQTKSYGTFTDAERKLSRSFVEHCLAEKFGFDPASYKAHHVEKWKHAANRNVIYFDDYSIDLGYPAEQFPKGFTDSKVPHIKFSNALCLKCGRETQFPQSGICGVCNGSYKECSTCHAEISDGRAQHVNGKYMCKECLEANHFPCGCCGNWHEKGTEQMIHGNPICKSCIKNYYYKCDHCNEFHKASDVPKISIRDLKQTWCKECFKRDGFTCSDCRQKHSKAVESVVTLKDAQKVSVCNTCVPAYSTCAKCQVAFKDGHDTSDGKVCVDCFGSYDYCTHCETSVPKEAMTFDGQVISCIDCAVKREAKEATPASYVAEITAIMEAVKVAEVEKTGDAVAILKAMKEDREATGYKPGDIVRVTADKVFHGVPIGSLITLCKEFKNAAGAVSYCHFRDKVEWFITPAEIEFVRPAIVEGDSIKLKTGGVYVVDSVTTKPDFAIIYNTANGAVLAELCEPSSVIDPVALLNHSYRVGEVLEIVSDVSRHGFVEGNKVKVFRVDKAYGMNRYFVKKGAQQGCIWGNVDVKKPEVAAVAKKTLKKAAAPDLGDLF